MNALVLMALLTAAPTQTFEQANAAYEEQRFDQAAALYESLVDQGVVNGHLFYNLGNAHFRRADIGRAVLNYQRALRLIPRHRDLRQNIRVVAPLRQDADMDAPEQNDAWTALNNIRRQYTLNETICAWLAVYILLMAAVICRMWLSWRAVRAIFPYILWPSVVLLFPLGLAAAATYHEQMVLQRAVVVAQEAPVRTGPGDDETYVVLFRVHAGTSLRVLDTHVGAGGVGYVKVAMPNGFEGWTDLDRIAYVDWNVQRRAQAQHTRTPSADSQEFKNEGGSDS